MSTRVVDRVEDWDERSFTGGYRELHDLAGRDFSGVIRAGSAELYMTRGVPVGIRQGSIDDFEDETGTIYEAPSPALPLLAIMQERSDKVKDKFYSEKTAISEVDGTLSEGGFTGFIELSENVLSGDYYLVYHAGESMSVGFVGNSARLIDGDEAFETTDDEVGIYEVRPVEIEPVDIPEPSTTGGTTGSAGTAGGSSSGSGGPPPGGPTGAGSGDPQGADAVTQEPDEATGRSTAERSDTGTTAATGAEPTDAGQEARARDDQQTRGRDDQQTRGRDDQQTRGRDDQTQRTQDKRAQEPPRETTERRETSQRSEPQRESDQASRREEPSRETSQRQPRDQSGRQPREDREPRRESERVERDSGGSPARGQPTEPRESSQQSTSQSGSGSTVGTADLEQQAIPSLDPSRTKVPEKEDQGGSSSDGPEPDLAGRDTTRQSGNEAATTQSEPAPADRQTQEPATSEPEPRDTTPESGVADQGADIEEPSAQPVQAVEAERIEQLEEKLDERDSEIDHLETELETAENEQKDLRMELESVRDERDELAAEVEQLESQLQRLETELGAATDADRRMTPSEALRGTDIFVRYHSKGEATLEKAHGSGTRREDVNENLRLEKHTQFDKETVAVGGQEYHEFLESTVEYQFVEWFIRELLFEIRETGHEKALKDLYDVLPQVDRAELAGVVEASYTEDGQETRTEESFDIVLRNRMGNPLLVANLNDSREAATEAMMESLITAAERVGQSADAFSGAFLVTKSFFDPGALEIASEATQGGLLSRDKRKSFVNLSRKHGYHLCLVEARNENFHLAVPEL